MAQTIWKGAISFGLVSIPVRLYAATDERGVALHQVHAADGGRIRYRRICEIDGTEVAYRDIAKGYQLPDGDMIVLTDEDLSQLPLASSKTVEVVQFVPASDLDPINFARTYYLQADGQGDKPYVLLRDALKRTEKLAVVKVALRSRESLAILRPFGDVIVLQMMLWPDEVRDAEAFVPDEDISVRPQEIDMAESYIEALTGEFDPSEHTDQYREALNEVIEAKAAGRPIREEPAPEEEAGEAVDLMEALRRSVAEAKARRSAQSGGSAVPEQQPAATSRPAKKTAAKKAPAKKTAAKKTAAAKKPAAKRSTARSEKASA